jgi:hypothetical protein
LRALILVILLIPLRAAYGVQQCSTAPGCFSNGEHLAHFALAGSFPYSEDISSNSEITQILWDPAHQNDFWNQPWTTVQTACPCQPGPPGNIVNAVASHVLLRGAVTVQGKSIIPSDNSVVMEVELVVDNPPAKGHYSRRLKPTNGVGQAYTFEASAQNLAPGSHTFSMRARLLKQATVYVAGYTTSVGVPAALYPSSRAAGGQTVEVLDWQQSGYTAVTPAVTINTATPVDLALQGYAQVSSLTGGAARRNLIFKIAIDNNPNLGNTRQSSTELYLPPSGIFPADGVNVIDHWLNFPTGSHTIQLFAATDSGTARLDWPQIEYVAFPRGAASPAVEAQRFVGAGYLCDVMGNDYSGDCNDGSGLQGTPLAGVQQGNGPWTLLAETELPIETTGTLGSWAIDGYVQFRGSKLANGQPLPGPGTWGQLAIETITTDGAPAPCTPKAVDMGLFNFIIPDNNQGMWFFGDAGQWGVSDPNCSLQTRAPTRLRMWIRSVQLLNDPIKAFLVGDRYFSVKIAPPGTPIAGETSACTYDAPPPGLKLYTLPPCRITDTRGPAGPYGSPALQGSQTRRFNLTGVCGVPASAKAVAANVTVTGSTQPGVLQIFPTFQPPRGTNGEQLPLGSTSVINYSTGQTRANNAHLGLSCDGRVDVIPAYQSSSSIVEFILDVVGYYQ